jgi:hypothetical protein
LENAEDIGIKEKAQNAEDRDRHRDDQEAAPELAQVFGERHTALGVTKF